MCPCVLAQCVAFECTPSLADTANVGPLGAHCELWSMTPQFAGMSSPHPPYSAYYCYVKSAPPPAPPPNYMIAGYTELLHNGRNGPCRLETPTDIGEAAYGGNKVRVNTMNCDVANSRWRCNRALLPLRRFRAMAMAFDVAWRRCKLRLE